MYGKIKVSVSHIDEAGRVDDMRKNARTIEFDVDAYTARLIGRENVSKLEGAVLEIVKNAYDADAKTFCLYYSGEKQCIYIMDNGTGMKEEVLRTHWMTIGNSSKRENYLSPGKRVQTGAKGIGRFALDRISDRCRMLTISEAGGLEWVVDWEDFSDNKKISEVKATIYDTDMKLPEYADMAHWKNAAVAEELRKHGFDDCGTLFCLEGLHDVWDERTMERLRNHLENLLPPDVVEDFSIFFFGDDTDVKEAEVQSSNVDSYDYRIDFQVRGDSLEIQIKRNEFDFRGEEKEVFEKAGFSEEEQAYFHGKVKYLRYGIKQEIGSENCIGDYAGTLYFNKISQTEKDQKRFYYKDIKARTNLTRRFGGIKLYRDKFRVRPYGEYGDNDFDWLELSARRNRSPVGLGHKRNQWRAGSEQMLGSVYITRNNHNLEDAANRNGIQEGPGFVQLKKVIVLVIEEFERDRQFVGRKLAEYAREQDALAAEVEQIHLMAEARRKWEEEQGNKSETEDKPYEEVPVVNPAQVAELLDALEQKQKEELRDMRDEGKVLQTLATTGIVTNMFMHEIRTLTNNIGQELDAAYEAIQYDQDVESALKNIRQAIAFKKNFASWFGITIEAIRKDKRRRKKHNIKEMLSKFVDMWKDILAKNDVELLLTCDDDIEFYCFEFDIENIISNLISNSLTSFEREMETVLEERKIQMEIIGREKGFVINYQDTGWGLIDRYKVRPELILNAFESSKVTAGQEEDGTGMGMWIVNTTVLDYNGDIDLSKNKECDKGFHVRIRMGDEDV